MTENERNRPAPIEGMMDTPLKDDPESPYVTGCCSFMGLHHVNDGLPCQDNSGCLSGPDYSIAVTSDGHSDYHCFRSDVGSTIATAVALESLGTKFRDGGLNLFLEDTQCDPEGQLDLLWKEIVIAWKMRVKEYDNSNPVTDEEKERLRARIGRKTSPEDVEQVLEDVLSQPVFRFYGCTLRVAIQFENGYILLSLGDGETIVIRKDGTTESPIPDDDDTQGSETHSMCDDNPFGHCRHFLGNEGVTGIAVCSDGIHCADESADNRYYIGEFMKRTFKSLSEENWRESFEDSVFSFTTEFPKDDCSVAFTVCRNPDAESLETVVAPLTWNDEPVSCTVSERSFGRKREFGYIYNVFDERCYRGVEGMELMHPLITDFCDSIPGDIRNSENREEAFLNGLKLMLQKWNRAVMDHDQDNPDTPEQELTRLTNGIVVQNRSQKYGLSLAVSVTVGDRVYSALVGKGSMTITTPDGDSVLEYEEPESVAHINFRNIRHSVDDASLIVVKGMDGSSAATVLSSRKHGLI